MKKMVSAVWLLLLLLMAGVSNASDCSLSRSVLLPYNHGGAATRAEWRASRTSIEHLMAACPAGPVDSRSRAIFFQLVAKEFTYEYTPSQEGESESVTQFQHDLQRYMTSITTERDLPSKSAILTYGNAEAIGALGVAVKDDVLRMAREQEHVVGYSRHSPQRQALATLGYWIDPRDSRFSASEKREMTSVLLARLGDYGSAAPLVGQPYTTASVLLKALAHSDEPEVVSALRTWTHSPDASLREVALRGSEAVQKRLQQDR